MQPFDSSCFRCGEREVQHRYEETIIDTARVRAAMLYPLEFEKQKNYWGYLKKPETMQHLRVDERRAVTLTAEEFDIVSGDYDISKISQEERIRASWGWVTSMAFHFYIRATVWSAKKQLPGNAGPLISANKMVNYIGSKCASINLPNSASIPTSESAIKLAISHLWAAGHYWAAQYTPQNPGFSMFPNTPEQWGKFMMTAETLRIIGIQAGVFAKLSGEQSPECSIVFDSRFPPFERSDLVTHITDQELAVFSEYMSPTSKKKSNKRRKTSGP